MENHPHCMKSFLPSWAHCTTLINLFLKNKKKRLNNTKDRLPWSLQRAIFFAENSYQTI
uniref:Uncharacterized protein n=1 Tax=Rhizophora mucronata TaxID=61149 RepID=A0A2P2R1B5_RHIMU